jgi:hypothetical protein
VHRYTGVYHKSQILFLANIKQCPPELANKPLTKKTTLLYKSLRSNPKVLQKYLWNAVYKFYFSTRGISAKEIGKDVDRMARKLTGELLA